MSEPGGIIPRGLLGAQLKKLRDKRGATLEEVAADLLISTSKLSRLETGQGLPQKRDIRDLAAYYKVSESSANQMLDWVEASAKEPWWEEITHVEATESQYLWLETAASEIQLYTARLIPSLAQTEAYARNLEVMTSNTPPENLEEVVSLRMTRQKVWQRPERPALLHMIVEESALLRQVGSPQVMGNQLLAVADIADSNPHVTVQVLELSRGPYWAASKGTFTLFRFPPELGHPDVVNPEALGRYLSDERTVLHHVERLDALTDVALTPEESIHRLRTVATQRYGTTPQESWR